MVKKKIRTFSLLLLLLLILSINTNVSANNQIQEKDNNTVLKMLEKLDKFDEKNNHVIIDNKTIQLVDGKLMDFGVEGYVLENLRFEQKRVMLKHALEENGVYSGSTVLKYKESTGEVEEYNPNAIKLFSGGDIPEEDLVLVISAWNFFNSDGTLSHVRVESWYNWKNAPFNRLQDPMVISWAEDENFSFVDYSFEKVDYYEDGSEFKVKSSSTRPSSISSQFIKWYADLALWGADIDPVLFGYGAVDIKPDNPTSSGNIQLYLHYVHEFVGASVTITYAGAGVEVGGSSFSEAATSHTHYWSNTANSDVYKTEKTLIERPLSGVYTITDSGRFNQDYDIIRFDRYYNINLDTMKELGYNYISMNVTLNMKEENDGYQGVLIFSEKTESNDYLLGWSGDLECGGPGIQSSYVDMNFSINNIDINKFDANDNRFIVRYGAHGNYSDTWYNRYLRIELVFSKTPL